MRAAVEAYESYAYRKLSRMKVKATEHSTCKIIEGLNEATKLKKEMGL